MRQRPLLKLVRFGFVETKYERVEKEYLAFNRPKSITHKTCAFYRYKESESDE